MNDSTKRIIKTQKELNNLKNFEQLKDRIHTRYPEVRVRYKNRSSFWEKLPGFLRQSSMATYPYIWLADYKNKRVGLLAHEYQHIVDQDSMGILFWLKYMFPQCLALPIILVAILAFIFGATTVGTISLIISLVALAPWPSKTRAKLEIKAYILSLYVAWKEHKDVDSSKNNIIDSLCGWLYYKMIWRRTTAMELVEEALEQIEDEENIPSIGTAFYDTYELFKH